jgi:hypothetical protein
VKSYTHSISVIYQKGTTMKTLPSVFLLVAMMALATFGCKKDDAPTAAPEEPVIPAELVGVWIAQSVTFAGQPKTMAETFSLVPNATTVALTFTAAGGFSFKHVDASKMALESMDGTAKVEGTSMLCTVTWNGAPLILVNGPWQLSGGQLTITSYAARLGGNATVIYSK